jgi:hypothetical protein
MSDTADEELVQITEVLIVDGANFNRVLARRCFGNESRAYDWAYQQQDRLRRELLTKGEKDMVFVGAIDVVFDKRDFVAD